MYGRNLPPEDDWREAVYRRAIGDMGTPDNPQHRKGTFNGQSDEDQEGHPGSLGLLQGHQDPEEEAGSEALEVAA